MLVIVTAGVAFPSKNNFLKALCVRSIRKLLQLCRILMTGAQSMVLGKRNNCS